jgi:RPA family protein
MSSNSNSESGSDSGADSDDQGGAGRREVAYRLFAAEFEDADFSYSESDEERAPNYVVTPTGARVNRLFLVGVLTEVEEAGEDILRARIVDPTGAFVVYAGQYQPEAQAFFDRAEPPAFVAVTGKARTFQPEDSDVTYISVRPENVNEVDAETRDRWSVGTARQTLSRVATMAGALDREERGEDLRRLLESQGVDIGFAAGIPLAIDHYGTTGAYLEAVRDLSVQVAEVVTGERDEVDPFSASPDASGPADLAALATLDVPASPGGETDVDVDTGATPEATDTTTAAETTTGSETESTTTDSAEIGTETTTEESETTETDGTAGAETAETDEVETAGPSETESEPVPEQAESAGAAEEQTATETGVSAGEQTTTEAGTSAAEDADTGDGDEIGDFEPGEFELDEEEREAIEEEYGTGFQSGNEVDEPGEADIDTPEPNAEPDESDDVAETATEAETETEGVEAETESAESEVDATGESEDDAAAEPETETETTADEGTETEVTEKPETDTADAADVDLDEAVMDAMQANDEGDGASEDAIVAAVTDRLGVDEDEVREALQEALMGGQCYEPEDGVYKPI